MKIVFAFKGFIDKRVLDSYETGGSMSTAYRCVEHEPPDEVIGQQTVVLPTSEKNDVYQSDLL